MAGYKHSDPTHLAFGRSGDSSLLRKSRGYQEGGEVEDATHGQEEGPSSWAFHAEDLHPERGKSPVDERRSKKAFGEDAFDFPDKNTKDPADAARDRSDEGKAARREDI